MVMMMISSNILEINRTIDHEITSVESSTIISPTPAPTWKLYDNPFYYSRQKHHHHHPHLHSRKQFHLHRIHLPTRARQSADSFWDIRPVRPVMGSELDRARAQIVELKTELELERRARKKTESVNKMLVREINEERQGREALERVCEELWKKVSANRAQMAKMKREIEEERRMLRMAEVFREERVQMKLAEAKFLLEQKVMELEEIKQSQTGDLSCPSAGMGIAADNENSNPYPPGRVDFSREEVNHSSEEKLTCNSMLIHQRKLSPEPENPHIKMGIKGFVEFPKVVRAIGSRNRHSDTKWECQRAQLTLLLKQKSPISSNNNLIMS